MGLRRGLLLLRQKNPLGLVVEDLDSLVQRKNERHDMAAAIFPLRVRECGDERDNRKAV